MVVGTFLALALIGGSSAASSTPASLSPTARSWGSEPLPAHESFTPRAVILFQGFEAAVPPSGWSRTSTASPPHTWHARVDSTLAHEGIQSAAVDWADVPQDEKLTSPSIDLSGVTSGDVRLRFWWWGNPFWAASADFIVSASTDGASWTDVWRMSDVDGNGFAWHHTDLDVGSYAGGNLRVRFRYVGTEGANLLLDEVAVVSDEPPPPVPANDDCAGAVSSATAIPSGPFALDADNTLAGNDYPLAMPGSCTGYTHSGRDLVWIADLAQGETLNVTMTTVGGWDDTLFLVSSCADAAGTCVAGDNAIPDGSHLSFTRTAAGTGRYYLIASGYADGGGTFHLAGNLGVGSSVETVSWGRVKAMYR